LAVSFDLEKGMKFTRRQIIRGSLGTVGSCIARRATATMPLDESPEAERFRKEQSRVLARYGLAAESQFVQLKNPSLRTHVLVVGRGEPALLIHGGGTVAVTLAGVMTGLTPSYRCIAPDRPGCGLTDGFDYTNVPFRQHAINFVQGILDALNIQKASLIGNSMGGLWSLYFALAAPDRVRKVVLLGGPAASAPPPPHPRQPRPPTGDGSIEDTKRRFSFLMADANRAPVELLEADFAASRIPGASRVFNSMVEDCSRERATTYALRPELKYLKPPTVFIYGEQDMEGPSSLAREMAAMVPNARCEIIPDAGHLVWLDQPNACMGIIKEFLRSPEAT
jgi:pimeloyl-ACP methyl ester carboxylesterase